MADIHWTPPKSLTFFGRMRATFWLWRLPFKLPAGWLKVLWSDGATVSFRVIARKTASLRIVSGNGQSELELTFQNRRETAM